MQVVLNSTQNGPELDTLKLIVSESKKRNKPTIVTLRVFAIRSLPSRRNPPACTYAAHRQSR
jgi:hypothetical protein